MAEKRRRGEDPSLPPRRGRGPAAGLRSGLYEFWPDPTKDEDAEDKWLVTATILTRAAHDALGHIHDRTPVIIPTNLQDQWLDPTMTERNQVQHFIDTIPEPNLVPRIVSKEVGSVRNNGPQLVLPAV
ncbi:SOS response-associated peptidase family protein [Arthrobacter sp. CP30]